MDMLHNVSSYQPLELLVEELCNPEPRPIILGLLSKRDPRRDSFNGFHKGCIRDLSFF